MKTNKVLLMILFLLLSLFTLSACFSDLSEEGNFYIKQINTQTVNVGEELYFDELSISSNDEVFKIVSYSGIALSEGTVEIRRIEDNVITHYITVINDPKIISVSGKTILKVGETTKLDVIVSPLSSNQELEVNVYDKDIISVSETYELTALKEGLSTIEFVSKTNSDVRAKFNVIVQNEEEVFYEPDVKYNEENVDVSLNTDYYYGMLDALTKKVINTVVGVEKYILSNNKKVLSDFGSGIIYRRDAILKDGTIITNITDLNELDVTDILTFKYYVISTRNLVQNSNQIKIYLGENISSCNGTIIEYDDKIDLAVLTFESLYYFNTAKLGDSTKVEQGEFILSIGNSNGKDYFRSATFGVVSHTKRYIATDTDGDEVSDWDSEYIQHDATINSGDNGGAIVNMKGEIIGINSTKLVSTRVPLNCMSFAIPSNLTKEIVAMLEVGNKPQRALLGVSIIDVRAFYSNKEAYIMTYPEMKNIPDGLEYGFYVSEVTPGGVAHMANVLPGDVILEFNGVTTKFSYQMRAELGKFIIGSGEKAYLKVFRNGQIVTLEVVF